MNINKIQNEILKYGYFKISGMDFGPNPHKYAIDFGKIFGDVVDQNGFGNLTIDIKPDDNFNIIHPHKGINSLGLHIDGFFKNLHERPNYVIIFCINPGEGGETIICDIKKTLEKIKIKYGESKYIDIININIKKSTNGIKIGKMQVDIYQKYNGIFFEGKLLEIYNGNEYFCITDNMKNDDDLIILQKELDKNIINLGKMNKGDILIINNNTFAHGRTKIISKDRFLIRIQVKKS